MIIGIGTDLVSIDRITTILKKYETRFITRVFSDSEQNSAKTKENKSAYFAKRFACKEACVKALGTGISSGIVFKDISIESLHSGKPSVMLCGKALERLKKMTPHGKKAVIHATITDESSFAQAFVIIEAIKDG
ncbi:MAG: holo-ACP synthase [Alphaproteobacteria bacterium]|nr:holo-ACP synthase [Alphaproteobacteria bacterium]MCL2505825.1 holo-ACP synthase [Alphaproteobacteria bacterium]